MPKIKIDVSGATPGQDYNHAKPGLVKAEILEINAKTSKANNPMLEIVFQPKTKKKKDKPYAKVFYYILTDGTQDGRLREFTDALGIKPKGTLDTDKLIGKTLQVNLKSDTDQDGEYRPKVGKVIAPEGDEEPDEEDTDDGDEEDEEDDSDDDGDDDSDDDDDEASEDEDEDSDDEEEEDSTYSEEELDELSNTDLKEILSEWEVELDGKFTAKKAKAAILEAQEESDDDEEGDDDEEESPDYSEWDIADLKKELKERGLSTKGKKSQFVTRLEEDDESDEDPFSDDDDDE